MKKLTTVLRVASLTAVLGLMSGCSSAPAQMAASDTTLSDPSADPSLSAIPTAPDAAPIAEAAPALSGTLMADNSATPAPLTLSDAAPAAMISAAPAAVNPSPVNLGASSAGRAH